MFDPAKQTYTELPPVLPEIDGPDNFIMHLGVIDIGKGPLLIQWSEFDIAKKTGQARARFLFSGNEMSSDFVLGLVAGTPAPWPLVAGLHYWYGDYQTSWAYETAIVGAGDVHTYHYYPMWIEPTRTVSFAHIVVQRGAGGLVTSLTGSGAPRVIPIKPSETPLKAQRMLRADIPSEELMVGGEEKTEDEDQEK